MKIAELFKNKIVPPLVVLLFVSLVSFAYQFFINYLTLTFLAAVNIIIYLFILIFSYIAVLKIQKSYMTAFIAAFFIAILPNFVNIFPVNPLILLSILIGVVSVVAYMLIYSQDLKYNQDKMLLWISFILYVFSSIFSVYSVALPFVLLAYELIKNDLFHIHYKRLIPFFIAFPVLIALFVLRIIPI